MASKASYIIPTSPTPVLREESQGYKSNLFEGKGEQMVGVCSHIEEKGLVPKDLIQNEVAWFYG